MKRFVLLLGGTGARIADALITAACSGVFPAETLQVLLADPDRRGVRSSGMVAAKMADYACIQQAMDATTGPFSAKLDFTAWPRELPGGTSTLRQWTDEERDDALLCQALFDRDAADIDLHEGFGGRRMLGQVTFAGLLHAADQDPEDTLSCLVDDMVQAINEEEEVRAVLVGSVCGGTGAAGFPALCEYIRRRTQDKVRLGALLLGANTEQEDAALAQEAIQAYAKDGLCETIGVLAVPASSRTSAPVEYPQLTDWLAVYMLDVLLHRPAWLTGLFTVRAPEGEANWEMFGQSAQRYRIAYGQLMKTAAAWAYALSGTVEKRLTHPFFLRDGLLGWYAHFFRKVEDRQAEIALLEPLDRLMSVCLLWLGGVSRTLPIDMKYASILQKVRREAAAHYEETATLESQLGLMDEDVRNEENYADSVVYRHAEAEEEEGELTSRRVEAVKQEVARRKNEQVAFQRRMGGMAAMELLEDALEEATRQRDELRERHEEAVRRIDHAERIAAEAEQYRIHDARTKLQRLERHQRMVEEKVRCIQADLARAREQGQRFDRPAMSPAAGENGLFLPEMAEKLLLRDQITRAQMEKWWPHMVCPEETQSFKAAMKEIRHAGVDRKKPLMSLLQAMLDASMQGADAGKGAKR